jgi:hypothetical protein
MSVRSFRRCLFYATAAQVLGTADGAGKLFDFGVDAAK